MTVAENIREEEKIQAIGIIFTVQIRKLRTAIEKELNEVHPIQSPVGKVLCLDAVYTGSQSILIISLL